MSNSAKVQDIVSVAGDVHHIFPKEYLKQNGITEKTKYNQVANYVYLDTVTNIAIGKKAPNDYGEFLLERRKLIAEKIKAYYFAL